MPLRVLTVRNPWCWAMAEGAKLVENRSQQTHYRGQLALHAGLAWSARGADSALVQQVWRRRYPHDVASRLGVRNVANIMYPGHVVAVADLVDCHPDMGCCRPWGESLYTEAGGRQVTNLWHLVLADVVRIPPVACRGSLGLWQPDPDLAAELHRALGAARQPREPQP